MFVFKDVVAGRFAGSKVFIEEPEKAVPRFYEQVGQRLRAWVAPPPKLLNATDPVEAETEVAEQKDASPWLPIQAINGAGTSQPGYRERQKGSNAKSKD